MLTLVLALSAHAVSQPEILGINWETGDIALRRQIVQFGDGASPTDCKYGGMKVAGGIRLELTSGATWDVYDAVGHERECTPPDVSSQRLAAAKAAFLAAGIHIDEPPKVSWIEKKGGAIEVGGRRLAVSTATMPDDPWLKENRRREEVAFAYGLGNRPLDDCPSHGVVQTTIDGAPWITRYRAVQYPGFEFVYRPLGVLTRGDVTWVLFLGDLGGWRNVTVDFDSHRLDPAVPVVMERPVHALQEGEIQDVEIQHLDTESGLAAVKLVSNLGQGARSCAYPGVEDPRDGVLLGVWDLAVGGLRDGFEVYAAGDDARRCTTPEEATLALESAKARWSELGLAGSKPPQRHDLSKGATIGVRKVAVDAGDVTLDGSAVWKLPEGARALSAWSQGAEFVVVYVSRGPRGMWEASLSPLLGR